MEMSEARTVTVKIKALLASITTTIDKTVDLIEKARAGDAHLAMGYSSWTDYVAGEFADALSGLERAERIPVTAKLTETGMSRRAVSSVLGTSVGTVHSDLGSGVQSLNTCSETTGTDGKKYLRSGRPTASTMADIADRVPEVQKPPRRRPLPDQYRSAVFDLDKIITRMEKLQADDRFDAATENYSRNTTMVIELLSRLTQIAGPHVDALENHVSEYPFACGLEHCWHSPVHPRRFHGEVDQ